MREMPISSHSDVHWLWQTKRSTAATSVAFYVVRFQNSRPDQLNDVTVKLRLHLFDVLCFGFVVQQIETSGV